MHPILGKLQGGDRRSIGRSDEVVAQVLADPALLAPLAEGLLADDPLVRMRAADALEKVTAQHPDWLQAHKALLLGEAARLDQQEVRWHVAQMLPRLELSAGERARAVAILRADLDHESRIVRAFALQALSELADRDPAQRQEVLALLEELSVTGCPAVRSRARKLLAEAKRRQQKGAGANPAPG